MRNRIGKGLALIAAAGALALSGSAALAAEGDLDPTFSQDGKLVFDVSDTGRAKSVAVDSGSRVVAAGFVDPSGADAGDFAIARFTPDGSPDPTFSGDGLATVDIGADDADVNDANGVAIDSNGNILVGGTDGDAANSQFAVVRLSSSGSVDGSYGGGDGVATLDPTPGNDVINDIALDGNNKVAAGGTAGAPATADFAVALFASDGSPDSTYGGGDGFDTLDVNPASTDAGEGVAIDTAGRVVVAGSTALVAGEENFAVARWTSAGVPDSNFSGDGSHVEPMATETAPDQEDRGHGVAIGPSDKVVVAGEAEIAGQSQQAAILVLTSTGALDTSFSSDGKAYTGSSGDSDRALDVTVDGLGKYVYAGNSDPSGGAENQFLVGRLQANGDPDNKFGNGGLTITDVGGGDDQGESVYIDPKTKRIVVAGFNGASDFALARYEGVPRCKGKVPTLAGTQKDDKINGTKKADVVWGAGGKDQVKLFKGKDTACGDNGNDNVRGGKGKDTVLGGKGADRLSGQGGADILSGNKGKDTLLGGKGKDKLKGGPGKDVIKQGGKGKKKKKKPKS